MGWFREKNKGMAAEQKPGVKSSSTILPCFLFVELVIMAGTVLLAYYFEYTDTFPVHIQGFFCYDKSFSKPYPGPDERSKIPPVLIYSLVTAIPTFTVRLGSIYFSADGMTCAQDADYILFRLAHFERLCLQVTCVINNFRQLQPCTPPLLAQHPESVLGVPMVTLPCVESPLDNLNDPLSPRSHDQQPYRFPANPDVLTPSRSISSEA
uniref:Phospholipid phosphatase related 2a n=1 Tax=Oryzias sinensis TaxID=183150 RepID=A0A8C7YSR4_9TELE